MLQGKKVVIFDLDGTLIDSVAMWNRVDVKLVEKIANVKISEQQAQNMRDSALATCKNGEDPYLLHCEIIKSTFESSLSSDELYKMRYAIAYDMQVNEIDYKDDAHLLIRKLKEAGYTLAIASTTNRDNLQTYRTQNKNIAKKASFDDYFTLMYAREDAKNLKPHPEIYLKVMSTLGVKPEECLVFEDSLVGIEASCSAGIESVVIYDKQSDADREKINALATYVCNTYENFIKTAIYGGEL